MAIGVIIILVLVVMAIKLARELFIRGFIWIILFCRRLINFVINMFFILVRIVLIIMFGIFGVKLKVLLLLKFN